VLAAESKEELRLLLDSALCSRRSGASAIERYCRSVRSPAGSVERAVLDAMCNAKFVLLVVECKHPVAGLVVRNAAGEEKLWLMDEMMEATAEPGHGLAVRLIQPDEFCMTTGTPIPMDRRLLLGAPGISARRTH
jgi:hypothetical protein